MLCNCAPCRQAMPIPAGAALFKTFSEVVSAYDEAGAGGKA